MHPDRTVCWCAIARMVFLASICWCAIFGIDPATRGSSDTHSVDSYEDLYGISAKERNSCGRSALYVFLQMLGHRVSFADVKNELPEGSDGLSLLVLRNACRDLGCAASVKRIQTVNLPHCRFPVIFYGGHGRTLESAKTMIGHFSVLTRISKDEAFYIDGSSASLESASLDWLCGGDDWIYFLEADADGVFSPIEILVIALANCCCLVAIYLWLVPPRFRKRSMVFVLAVMGASTASATEATSLSANQLLWRQRQFDAVNASYIILRLEGHNVDYVDVLNNIGTPSPGLSMSDVVLELQKFGLYGTIRKVTPKDLMQLPLPVMTIMENPETGDRHFALICGGNGEVIYLVDAGVAVWQPISIDKFRTRWSGIVYVPGSSTIEKVLGIIPLLMPGFFLGFLIRWWRARPAR